MSVTTETAVVYRGGGRRYFTKAAAYRAEAKAQLRAEMGGCQCEPPDWETGGGWTCDYHSLPPGIIGARVKHLWQEEGGQP